MARRNASAVSAGRAKRENPGLSHVRTHRTTPQLTAKLSHIFRTGISFENSKEKLTRTGKIRENPGTRQIRVREGMGHGERGGGEVGNGNDKQEEKRDPKTVPDTKGFVACER